MGSSSPRLFILVFLFVAALALSLSLCARAEPPQQERAALQAFLAGTSHERTLGWNSSAPSACLWFGVTCDADTNATVVAVRLPGVGLVGGLPPRTLGDLRGLRKLSLRSNRLSGAIPADLFTLPLLTSLYLQGNRFSGAIPPEVSGLLALQHLVLSRNNLSGAVPPELDGLADLRSLMLDGNRLSGNLPSLSGLRKLQVLNVSYNQLNGSIPSSLARFPRDDFAGNLQLCGEPLLDQPCNSSSPAPSSVEKKKKKKLSGAAIAAIAVGAGAGVLLAIFLLVLCAVYRHRAAKNEGKPPTARAATGLTPPSSDLGDITSSSKEISVAAATAAAARAGAGEGNRLVFVGKGAAAPYSFDLEDLLRASAEVLGKGSAGTSYRATLEGGEGTTPTVVVKRLKDVAASRREFASAMETLGKVEHRNLLPVRSYYFSKDEKLVVTDYLPSGSLSATLHGSRGSGMTAMDWEARKRASLSAARGVAHLHASYGVVHGDIKSSNLLLRPDLDAAALSDYGIQHLFAPASASSRGLSSSGGYRAPELVDARRPTVKSDVYSLGVLLLELLTGRSPTGPDAVDLPRWVQSVVREEWTAEVFDAELVRLDGGSEEEEMVALLQVAMACVATAPDSRPVAPDVVRMVEEIGASNHGRATTSREESVHGGASTAEEEEERSRWATPPTGASP